MALLKVTGMGRSPRWNLQKGTLLAYGRGEVGWGHHRPQGSPVLHPHPPPPEAPRAARAVPPFPRLGTPP